jgi:hypothetical protein
MKLRRKASIEARCFTTAAYLLSAKGRVHGMGTDSGTGYRLGIPNGAEISSVTFSARFSAR